MDKEMEIYLKEKYQELFNGVEVEIQSATKDLYNYIKKGAFWGTEKVAKHILGSTGVYEIYAYTIINDSLAPFYRKINAAKEGCGYALGKRNTEQFFRFLLYGADLNNNIHIMHELAYNCSRFYAMKGIQPSGWFIAYADIASEVAFKHKMRNEYKEFHTKIIYTCSKLFSGYDNLKNLYLLGLACYGNLEEKTFIEDCKKNSSYSIHYKKLFEEVQQMWEKQGCYINF